MSETFTYTGTVWTKRDGDIYVSRLGNDNATGSPLQPYKTLQKAVNSASNAFKIVIGSGQYTGNFDFGNKSLILEADGIVLFDGNGECIINQGVYSNLIGIKFSNYTSIINGNVAKVERCCFTNTKLENVGLLLYHSLLINSSLTISDKTKLANCTFINSSVEHLGNTIIDTIVNCHIGSGSSLILKSSQITYFDYCNLTTDSSVTINDVIYNSLNEIKNQYPHFLSNGLQVAPKFNDSGSLNYTLSFDSSLIDSGRCGKCIGAFGKAFYIGESLIDISILQNIQKTQQGYYTLLSETEVGIIETPIIEIGTPFNIQNLLLFAQQYMKDGHLVSLIDHSTVMGELTFEMRFANNADVLKVLPYQPFHWNDFLFTDINGKGNASYDFYSNGIKRIMAKFFQFRIKLRQNVDNFLIQENGGYLLQENGSKLILENQTKIALRGFALEEETYGFELNVRDINNIAITEAQITISTDGFDLQTTTSSDGELKGRSYTNIKNKLIVAKKGYSSFSQLFELIDISLFNFPSQFYVAKIYDKEMNPIKDVILQLENYSFTNQGLTDEHGLGYVELPLKGAFLISIVKEGFNRVKLSVPAITFPENDAFIPIPIIVLEYESL